MTQKPFYVAESYDLALVPSTWSASLTSQTTTVGTMFYTRLDWNGETCNGFLSFLYQYGTSSDGGSAYVGLYDVDPAGANLSLVGGVGSADFGHTATGLLRVSAGAGAGQHQVEHGCVYAGLLIHTDNSGTDKMDFAKSTAGITLASYDAKYTEDQTGAGQLPRCMYGAGTSLTALAATEVLANCTATDFLFWFGMD